MTKNVDGVDVGMSALVLIWGTAFVAIKDLTETLDPFMMTWLRYVPFLVLFGGWLLWKRRATLAALEPREWWRYLAVGLLGVMGYHIPLYFGMQDDGIGVGISAATAAILVSTTPLWTLLMATLSGQERLDAGKAVGSVIAFAGVAVVVLLGRGEAELTFITKALIAILAPIFWALFNILGKSLVDRHGGLFFTGMSMCLGTVAFIPYGLWLGTDPLTRLDAVEWLDLVYISVFATVAGYAIWNLSLRHRKPSELTAFIYFIPVVATLAGYLLLDEVVTGWFLVGAALVLAGVILVNRARLRQARVMAANA